jgi:hypothetical protein
MPKTLCKIAKLKRAKEKSAIAEFGATHICAKCARIASSKKKVCKPTKLPHSP